MALWDPVDAQIMTDMPDPTALGGKPADYWDHMMGVTGVAAYPQVAALMNAPVQNDSSPVQPQDFNHSNSSMNGNPTNVSSDQSGATNGFFDRNFPETMASLRGSGTVKSPTMKALGMGFKVMGGSASKLAQQENAALYEGARKQLWSINSPEKMPTFVPSQAGKVGATGSVNAQELYRYWLERLREFANIKEAVK